MKNHKLTSLILTIIVLIQMLPMLEVKADDAPVFPEITQAQFKEEMKKTIAKGHPYMLATKEDIAKVKEYAFGKDANLTKLYSYVKAEADALLENDIQRIDTQIANNDSYISKAENAWNEVTKLALIYLVEGDVRYAQRAYSQAEYLCKLESWGTSQQIDNCRLAYCVAFCYDWLYDWLSADQKAFLTENIRRLHLNMVSDVHHNPDKPEYKWSFHQVLFMKTGNHNIMDSSLAFLSAMAFADTDIDFMTDIMARTLPYALSCISGLYPDGIWDEGPSYWGFAAPFAARLMQSMKTAFGHCFDLDKIDFLNKLADYYLYTYSNNGAFNVGDCHFSATRDSTGAYDNTFYMMGALRDDIDLQSYAISGAHLKKSAEPFTVLMYDTEKSYDDELTLDIDKLFTGTMYQAVMRSSFNGTQNTFVGMNVKKSASAWNNHNDNGTIAFDALGERWITNKSRETYYKGYNNGSEERFTWYRARAEAQSCIVINPSTHRGQDYFSDNVGISVFESKKGGAYAIADLIKPYSTWATSYKRGIQLADNRKVFVVQDEIVLKEPSEMYSFFNIYEADIEILNDGKSAILSKNNKKVYVTIDCDTDFTLGKMAAEPLPTSALPDPSKPNTPNTDFMKLYLHFDNVESANIRVCFIPYICEEELSSVTCREFIPMSEWTAQEEMKEIPILEDIKIDGKSLDSFNPYNRCHDAQSVLDLASSDIELSYDTSKYTATLIRNAAGETLNVLLVDNTDSTNMNSYMFVSSVTDDASVMSTYTNSSYAGVMLPQEFYRIADNDELSVMYFKDEAPKNCTKAVLTLYASVVGESVDTTLRQCKLDANTKLEYLSGSNAPVSLSTSYVHEACANNTDCLGTGDMQRLEYDITSVLPKDGGDFMFALLPYVYDEDYMVVASHRNSDYSLRPKITYYYRNSQ